MSQGRTTRKVDTAIVVAAITLIGTLVTAVFGSPLLIEMVRQKPAQTPLPAPSNTPPVSPTPTVIVLPVEAPSQVPPLSGGEISGIGSPMAQPGSAVISNGVVSYSEVWVRSHNINACPNPTVIKLPDDFSPGATDQETLNKAIAYLQRTDFDNLFHPLITEQLEADVILTNSQGEGGLPVIVDGEVQSRVVSYLPAPAHVHALDLSDYCGILIPVTGGGQKYYDFSPAMLESASWKNRVFVSNIEEFDLLSISPGEAEALRLQFQCRDPGVYQVELTIDVTSGGQSFPIYLASSRELYCPESITLWSLKHQTRYGEWWNSMEPGDRSRIEFTKVGDFTLENGEYFQEVP